MIPTDLFSPALLPFLGPLLLALIALTTGSATGGPALASTLARAQIATLGAFVIAVLTALEVAAIGPHTSLLIGANGIGFSARLDALSSIMFLLVSFVGVIIAKYSRTYLAGEPGQARFTRWLLLTLASVQLLVISGNLVQLCAAWVLTSLALHKLLLFYPGRHAAQVAAKKKFWAARAADAALIAAAALLATKFNTTDIAAILDAATLAPGQLLLPALLIAAAAALKSGQFPSHGWLIEVMETPTPVSALLHAGIVNAGGFLVIRFADVMLASPIAMHALAILGGFTALFGAIVMLTQPSVKTTLAWSTVSQMGFMLLQCGLGAFSIAVLHIVAHSLYKAHAFLSSGSVVDLARAPKAPGAGARLQPLDAALGLGMTLTAFALIGTLFGATTHTAPALLGLGAITLMGVTMMVARSFAGFGRTQMLGRGLLLSLGVSAAWFVAQGGAALVLSDSLPPPPTPDALGLIIIALAVISFIIIALAQLTLPLWRSRPGIQAFRIHLINGLYTNLLWNRLIGAYRRS